MDFEEAKNKLEDQIKDHYLQLRKDFQAGRFKEMAKLLGKNTILFTPQGKRLKGKFSLKKFWKSEKKKKASQFKEVDIEFKPVHICPREVKNVEQKKDPQKTIFHFAGVISEYTITCHKSNGEIESGLIMTPYCHPQPCVWEP